LTLDSGPRPPSYYKWKKLYRDFFLEFLKQVTVRKKKNEWKVE